MKIGLVTTLGMNLGDDLVREGLCLLLQERFAPKRITFVPIHKHDPLSVYAIPHPVALARRLPRLRGVTRLERFLEAALYKAGGSRFDACEWIVQCGTPVLWPGCATSEWAAPLWDHVLGRLSLRGVPVMNLGGGSCYPMESTPDRLVKDDAAFAGRMASYSQQTTVRDALAARLFASIGAQVPELPCPALLAARPHAPADTGGDFIAVNFMPGAGHYDWGQKIDSAGWENTVRGVLESLHGQKLLMLCHDSREWEIAGRLAPEHPRFLPSGALSYFRTLRRARAAVVNRLHAAVALAGLGVPSVAVGTDTRLKMVEALGLPALYVKDAHEDVVVKALARLLHDRESERRRLLHLREQTWLNYLNILSLPARRREAA